MACSRARRQRLDNATRAPAGIVLWLARELDVQRLDNATARPPGIVLWLARELDGSE